MQEIVVSVSKQPHEFESTEFNWIQLSAAITDIADSLLVKLIGIDVIG